VPIAEQNARNVWINPSVARRPVVNEVDDRYVTSTEAVIELKLGHKIISATTPIILRVKVKYLYFCSA
jgi:hypothetical protein